MKLREILNRYAVVWYEDQESSESIDMEVEIDKAIKDIKALIPKEKVCEYHAKNELSISVCEDCEYAAVYNQCIEDMRKALE